jgi:hypothetical protein
MLLFLMAHRNWCGCSKSWGVFWSPNHFKALCRNALEHEENRGSVHVHSL